jgi:hypothetical protein
MKPTYVLRPLENSWNEITPFWLVSRRFNKSMAYACMLGYLAAGFLILPMIASMAASGN